MSAKRGALLACALAALTFLAPVAWGLQSPVEVHLAELEGPIEGLCLSAGGLETKLEISLAAGEVRRLRVPIAPSPGASTSLGAEFSEVDPPASARLAGRAPEQAGDWSALPINMQGRSLPPVQRTRPAPGSLRLALLAAAMILVLGLRRRPWLAALCGSAFAIVVLLAPAPVDASPVMRVLEGDRTAGRWLEVLGSRDRLELGRAESGWMRTLPSTSEAYIELAEGEGTGPEVMTICAPGARVFYMREPRVQPDLGRQHNAHADFQSVWVREPGGVLEGLGPWRRGDPCPTTPAPGAGSPPGWLLAAVPQGVPILLGVEAGAAEGSQEWLRLVGF